MPKGKVDVYSQGTGTEEGAMVTSKTESGRTSEGTAIPPEYSHLSGEDLDEAMECERSNDVEYLKRFRLLLAYGVIMSR